MKKQLRVIFLGLIIFTLLFSLIGCQPVHKQPSVSKPKVINISYATRPINIPTIVALEKKMFEEEFAKEGIEVKWHELAGPATTEALAANSIDIATSLNYVSAIVTKAGGNDIKIISGFSQFPKAIGLVAAIDSSISSVEDLKGKKIALQKGTMLHEMLLKALLENNLAAEDVEIVGMASPDAINAVLQKHVDAAVLPDPLLAKALSTKKVKLIRTAEGLIPGRAVIAARTEFIEKYPEIVRKFLEIHKKTLNWAEENKDEAFNMASKVNQMDIKAVRVLYPKFNFDMTLNNEVISELKECAVFLKDNGFLKADVDTDELINNLIDTSYLPNDF